MADSERAPATGGVNAAPAENGAPPNAPVIAQRRTSHAVSYDDTTIVGGCRRLVLRSFAHIPADWDSNGVVAIFNYLRYSHLHILRAMQPLLHPIASQEERSKLHGSYGIRSTGTLNLLTWRRSALFACFWIALGSALLLAAVARTSQDNLYLMQATADLPTNGTILRGCEFVEREPIFISYKDSSGNTTTSEYPQSPERVCNMTFLEYQEQILYIATSRVSLPAKQVDSILDLVLAGFAWIALVPTLMALVRWHRYGTSMRLVALAWMLTFLTPFIISITPVRMFVDWDAMDVVFEDFISEFRTHFATASKEGALISMCNYVRDYEGNHPYQLVEGTCSLVDQLPCVARCPPPPCRTAHLAGVAGHLAPRVCQISTTYSPTSTSSARKRAECSTTRRTKSSSPR